MNNEKLFENKIGVIGAGRIGRALILKLLEKVILTIILS